MEFTDFGTRKPLPGKSRQAILEIFEAWSNSEEGWEALKDNMKSEIAKNAFIAGFIAREKF